MILIQIGLEHSKDLMHYSHTEYHASVFLKQGCEDMTGEVINIKSLRGKKQLQKE